MKTNNQENMESFESLDNELEKNPLLDWEPMEGL